MVSCKRFCKKKPGFLKKFGLSRWGAAHLFRKVQGFCLQGLSSRSPQIDNLYLTSSTIKPRNAPCGKDDLPDFEA